MSTNSDIGSLKSDRDLEDKFRKVHRNLSEIIENIEKLKFAKKAPKNDSYDSGKNDKNVLSDDDDESQDSDVNFYEDSNDVLRRNFAMNLKSSRSPSPVNFQEESGEEDNELIERGPIRPQMHFNRSRPYFDTYNNWYQLTDPFNPLGQHTEPLADYDTSAKEILTDQEYRETIGSCLDKLSDMHQGPRMMNPILIRDSPYANELMFLEQQQLSPVQNGGNECKGPSSFLPSIMVNDPEEASLLEILSRGGFQAAQVTSDFNATSSVGSSSLACPSENWPDSPASSFNTAIASRPESRASSRAQSPGSGSGTMLLNIVGSPMGSPQVSPYLNLRTPQALSSSSSSNQSYCDTPSPSNYQNPLDQRLEEQLGDHFNLLPTSRENFESAETIVNSVVSVVGIDSTELQLVEEVIQDLGRKKYSARFEKMQVVPNSQSSPTNYPDVLPPWKDNVNHNVNNSCQLPPSIAVPNEENDASDEIANALLRIVGEKEPHTRERSEEIGLKSSYCSSNQELEETINNLINDENNRQKEQECPISNGIHCRDEVQFSTSPMDPSGRCVWPDFLETTPKPTIGEFIDFRVPKMVSSYNSHRTKSAKSQSRNSELKIAPWPSLNLPSTRTSERLKEETDPKEVEKAMKNLLKKPLEQLAKADEDGDTVLMCLVGNPGELRKKLAYLAPLVERLGSISGALSMTNNRGEDALYLAAMNCPQMAFVAGYLAAALLQKGIDVGQRLYRTRGDTLIHALAARGDSHGEVLAEMLALKTEQGNPVFDLSRRNYDGRTALHVAAEAHDPWGRSSKTTVIGTVRLLLERGSDPMIRDTKCGDTALLMAISLSCDPALVKVLLSGNGCEAVNVVNYSGNSPMHAAAVTCNRSSLERQSEVCWLLINAGGKTNLPNRQGKMPLALVSTDRKDAIKRVFHKKS